MWISQKGGGPQGTLGGYVDYKGLLGEHWGPELGLYRKLSCMVAEVKGFKSSAFFLAKFCGDFRAK